MLDASVRTDILTPYLIPLGCVPAFLVLGGFSYSTRLIHLLSPLCFVFPSNLELLQLQTQPLRLRKHKWQGSLLNLWSGRFLTCFLSDAFYFTYPTIPVFNSPLAISFLSFFLFSSFGYDIVQIDPQMEQNQQAAKETTVDADSSSSPSTQVRLASSFCFPPSWRGWFFI